MKFRISKCLAVEHFADRSLVLVGADRLVTLNRAGGDLVEGAARHFGQAGMEASDLAAWIVREYGLPATAAQDESEKMMKDWAGCGIVEPCDRPAVACQGEESDE